MSNIVDISGRKPEIAFKTVLDKPLDLGLHAEDQDGDLPRKSLRQKITLIRYRISRFFKALLKQTYGRFRNWLYRHDSDILLGKLTTVSRRLNRDDFHVMIDLSGHINGIRVSVYLGGYAYEKQSITILQGKLPGYRFSKMKPVHIKEAIKALKSLSRLNTVTEMRTYRN